PRRGGLPVSRRAANRPELGSKAARLHNACEGVFAAAPVAQPAQPATFSPVLPGEKSGGGEIGPGSNTGQKGEGGAIIDYLTLVVPQSAVEDFRCADINLLLYRIFG